jgi:hypothetical protein
MKRYPIEIVRSRKSVQKLKDRTQVSRKVYLAVLTLAKRIDLRDQIASQVEIVCCNCGSYALDFFAVTDLMDELVDYDWSEESEMDLALWEHVSGVWPQIEEDLAEAWYTVYDFGGNETTELAVIFNKECSCYPVFVGEPLEEPPDEPDYLQDPNISVKRWVGPRQDAPFIPRVKAL